MSRKPTDAPAPALAELRAGDRPHRRGHAPPADGARRDHRPPDRRQGHAGSGSAFRPGREAAMMRALAERHGGMLPLDTVEGIWRVIIATFTYVQAPFAVHADISGGRRPDARLAPASISASRSPTSPHPSAAAVIEAVAGVGAAISASSGPTRAPRRAPGGGRSPARTGRRSSPGCPSSSGPDHPAGTPVFVISKPLAEAAVRDVVLSCRRGSSAGATPPATVARRPRRRARWQRRRRQRPFACSLRLPGRSRRRLARALASRPAPVPRASRGRQPCRTFPREHAGRHG